MAICYFHLFPVIPIFGMLIQKMVHGMLLAGSLSKATIGSRSSWTRYLFALLATNWFSLSADLSSFNNMKDMVNKFHSLIGCLINSYWNSMIHIDANRNRMVHGFLRPSRINYVLINQSLRLFTIHSVLTTVHNIT